MAVRRAMRLADEMTLVSDDEGLVIDGGEEVIEDIRRAARPSLQQSTLGLPKDKDRGQLARTIERGGVVGRDGKPTKATSIARTLQRWEIWANDQHDKQARKPTAEGVQKYQDAYIAATGRANPALTRMLNALLDRLPSKLPRGIVQLKVEASIEAGSAKKRENRAPREVSVYVASDYNEYVDDHPRTHQPGYINVVDNPIAVWLNEFGATVELTGVISLTAILRESSNQGNEGG